MEGGTWANSAGYQGVRRNTDPSITVDKVLPNRYMASFADGNSSGTNGMNIYWDVSALNLTAAGVEKDYLKGYVGNGTYAKIKVEVKPFTVDIVSAKAQIIKQVSENLVIDPYTFNAEEFVAGLPSFFYYDYESGTGTETRRKTYLFNELKWSLDYTVKDGIKKYDSLDYVTEDFEPYINLTFRAYEAVRDADNEDKWTDAEGNTPYTTVKIPLKVKNNEVRYVESAVNNSIGGIVSVGMPSGYNGMITFNPLNNRDPYSSLYYLESFDAAVKKDGSVIKDWAIIPNSFESITQNGKNLANYDNSFSGEQSYAVSYKITDGTGYVQTMYIYVKILSSNILAGQSYYLKGSDKVFIENNRNLYPYAATESYDGEIANSYASGDVLARLYLSDNVNVVYESGYEERVALGETKETKKQIYVVYDEESGKFVAKGATVVAGRDFSYRIPYLNYADGGKKTVEAVIGQHGYARWELDDVFTDIVLGRLDVSYTLNKAKAIAYDTLYAGLNRYDKLSLSRILVAENNNKAKAWDVWYNNYADETKDTYSVNDVLKLDVMLTDAKLSFVTISYATAQSLAYERLLVDNTSASTDSNKISVTELREMFAEVKANNINKSTVEQQALTFAKWYKERTRHELSIERTVMERSAEATGSVNVSPDKEVTEDNVLDFIPSGVSIGYKGVTSDDGEYKMITTDVTWIVDKKELVEKMSYNGAIISAEALLKDELFGNQVLRSVGMRINQLKVSGIVSMFEEGDLPNVSAYDEKTIDSFLSTYYSADTLGVRAYAFAILIEGADKIVRINTESGMDNAVWELATSDSYYEGTTNRKILWQYAEDTDGDGNYDNDGISYNPRKGAHKIRVWVQSKNYNSVNVTGGKWQYAVEIDFTDIKHAFQGSDDVASLVSFSKLVDETVTDIVKVRVDGDETKASVKYNANTGRYAIAFNPSQVKIDESSLVEFDVDLGGTKYDANGKRVSNWMPATIGLDDNDEFYKLKKFDTTATFGTRTNNVQNVNVTLINKAEYVFDEVAEVVYKRDGKVVDFDKQIATSLDDLAAILPNTAAVSGTMDGVYEQVELPVSWSSIEEYGLNGRTSDGKYPTARALIGDRTFGYIPDRTVQLKLGAESEIVVSGIPDVINVDPYGNEDLEWMRKEYSVATVTSRVRDVDGTERKVTKTVDVKIAMEDVDLVDYRENNFVRSEYSVRFALGHTVTSARTDSGKFDVRYEVRKTVILRDRSITDMYIAKFNGIADGKAVWSEIEYITADVFERVGTNDFAYEIRVNPAESTIDAVRAKLGDKYNGLTTVYAYDESIKSGVEYEIKEPKYGCFIVYGSGTEATYVSDVTFEGIEDIVYTANGGFYTDVVKAVIGKGELKQTVPVTVNVKRALVTGIKLLPYEYSAGEEYSPAGTNGGTYVPVQTDSDGKVTRLVIEPFLGFSNLPAKVIAVVDIGGGEIAYRTVSAEWDGSLVTANMSIKGGEFNVGSTANVAYVTVYAGSDGERAGEQTIELSVTVPDRTVLYYEVSYDGENYKPLNDLVYGKKANATNYTNELLLNPYDMRNALLDAYAERKGLDKSINDVYNSSSKVYDTEFGKTDAAGNTVDNADFTFFRYVRIVCEDGYVREYKLDAKNYVAFSKANVKDFYSGGRSVKIDLRVGEKYSSDNNGTYAPDAAVLNVAPNKETEGGEFEEFLSVRVLDMTYGSGLEKDIYYIDPYGVLGATGKSGITFESKVVYPEDTVRNVKIVGKDSDKYFIDDGTRTDIATYVFEEVNYDGSAINYKWFDIASIDPATGKFTLKERKRNDGRIKYGSGVGKLAVTFGSDRDNSFAGTQVFNIPVVYVDRTVENLGFNGENAPYFKTLTLSNGTVEQGFEFDPFVTYNASVNGFGDSEQGFLKHGQYGTKLTFKNNDIDRIFGGRQGSTFEYDLTMDQGNDIRIGVTFEDKELKWRYTGGEFDIKARLGSGDNYQEIPVTVKLLSRRVDAKRAGTINGFSSDIFKSGVDLTTKVKAYDYIGYSNVEAKLISDYFVSGYVTFKVYFEDFDEPIEYTMNTVAASDGKYVLTDSELNYVENETVYNNGVRMAFTMDTTETISYRGGKLTFAMTIPGYGMGKNGQQQATVSIEMEEQYVIYANPADENSGEEITYDAFYKDAFDADAMEYDTSSHSMFVTNPYYFIQQGGVKMPDTVYAYVTTKALFEEYKEMTKSVKNEITGKYDPAHSEEEITAWKVANAGNIRAYKVDANWTGGSKNRLNVNFYDESISGAMTMPIDDQVYRTSMRVQPWLFKNTTDAITAFEDSTPYGPDDIILLPTKSYLTSTLDPDFYVEVRYAEEDGHPIYDANYTYIVHFKVNGEEKQVEIKNVDGGGTYRDNYNKWYFGAVKFGESDQYATFKLGGKGGQTFRWRFSRTSQRKWINSNIQDVMALRVGADGVNLEKSLVQYFVNGNSTNLESSAPAYIPVEYTNLRKPVNDDRYSTAITGDLSAKVVSAERSTPATVQSLDFGTEKDKDDNDVQIVNNYQIALLDWAVTGRRAYPSSNVKIGGTIILSGYGAVMPNYVYSLKTNNGFGDIVGNLFKNESNVGFNRFFVSDQGGNNKHALLAPNTEEMDPTDTLPLSYINSNVTLDAGYQYDDNMLRSISAGQYYVTEGLHEVSLSTVPTLYIKKGTKFAVHNLPLFQVNMAYAVETKIQLPGGIGGITFKTEYTKDSTYASMFIPWYKAKVYQVTGSDLKINGNTVTASGGVKEVEQGVAGINTNVSNKIRYVLCAQVSFRMSTMSDAEKIYKNRPSTDDAYPPDGAYDDFTFYVYTILRIN